MQGASIYVAEDTHEGVSRTLQIGSISKLGSGCALKQDALLLTFHFSPISLDLGSKQSQVRTYTADPNKMCLKELAMQQELQLPKCHSSCKRDLTSCNSCNAG